MTCSSSSLFPDGWCPPVHCCCVYLFMETHNNKARPYYQSYPSLYCILFLAAGGFLFYYTLTQLVVFNFFSLKPICVTYRGAEQQLHNWERVHWSVQRSTKYVASSLDLPLCVCECQLVMFWELLSEQTQHWLCLMRDVSLTSTKMSTVVQGNSPNFRTNYTLKSLEMSTQHTASLIPPADMVFGVAILTPKHYQDLNST